jgi:long-chain acyl-CoA synthetase
VPAYLTERLIESARTYGGRTAIKTTAREISYAALLQSAAAVASFLRASGLKRGDRVALILPNSIEAAAAWYAIWYAGGVVVPLNAQARRDDLGRWVEHSGAQFLIGDSGNAEVQQMLAQLAVPPRLISVGAGLAGGGATTWTGLVEGAAQSATEELLSPTRDDELALILYTSGTTGRPKGVMLCHGNLASNAAAIISYLRLTEADSIVSVLPFYYSYGSSILHTHLAVGARLVLEDNLVFPHVVIETLARDRATGFAGVPSTYALLLARVALEKYDLGALRYLTQAGGPMSPALTKRLLTALPNTRLFVMYGQTEATARLTYLPPERLLEKLGSVGVPIPGVSISVHNEQGLPLPPRQTGEVWVRGPNVMLGYWRDEAATASVLQAGWLKTGDMGYVDEDGYLFLAGRRSDMIKSGAHRIHPKDIEETIAELPEVGEVAVVGVDDEMLGQVVKALIVPAPDEVIDIQRVKAHCRERLAQYKIPKFIEVVPSLPKTASGKVRRGELVSRISQ